MEFVDVKLFDKNISLMFDRVLMVYGINGSGKTLMLKEIANQYPNRAIYYNPLDYYLPFYYTIKFTPVITNEAITKFKKCLNELLHNKTIIQINDLDEPIILFNNKPLLFYQLSEGEQNLIGIFYHIFFSPQRIICFDDIESHLHLDIQMRLISMFINESNKSFIISTHSPQLVNHLFDEAISMDTIKENGIN